ncbi:phage tail tape measure protein [Clostridium butyricum]
MKKAHASLKKVNDETKKTTENVGQMSNNMTNMASKVKTALATIGVSKVGKDIVETYATFEQSMSKVQALSGASGQDLQALTDKAKEMGEKTSKSASESADALGYMALAGWDTNQMLTGLEPMLRASEAGGMDLARCSDLITDSMSAMGIQVGDLNHYLDVCSKAQASSNTSLAQITEAYIGCGGTLKNMNVSVEESATLLGVLANRGKKGSEAGNALNSVLVNLMGTGGQASKALESLGVSMYNEDGTNKGITNTLRELNVALGNCTQKQKDQFEAMIGGKNFATTIKKLVV